MTSTEGLHFVGKPVRDPSGQVLGNLQDIIGGDNGPRAVIDYGGFLGFFQSQAVVDWSQAKPRVEGGNLVFDMTPAQLHQARPNASD